MSDNINNIYKYDFITFKKQCDSFNKFVREKGKYKQKLTKDILGDRLLQFEGVQAIEVGMDHYYLSIDNENMYTVGVASCCALYIEKDSKTFLLHISPISKTEDVINLLGFLVIDRNAHISIFPGPACKASETGFDYTKLAEELKKLNNDVVINPINSEYGNIFIFGRDIYVIDKKIINSKRTNM